MGTEKEASYPIEDFGGVNLNADKEDLQPNQLLNAQNLWEPTLGVLETRLGSYTKTYKPTAVTALGKNFKIYKSWGEETRLCAIQCTMNAAVLGVLPTGCSISFVDNPDAFWNDNNTFGAGTEPGITVSMTHPKLLLRFVGYGVDKWYEVDPTTVTGYAATTNQSLRVQTTASFDNSAITGIEIYARVKCGTTAVSAAISSVSAYQEQTMWCGFIDLTSTNVQDKYFPYCPAGYHTSIAANTVLSTSERSFTVTSHPNGAYSGGYGTFVGGKTYYVAVLPQHVTFSAGSASRCVYKNSNVNVNGGEVVAITIPGDSSDLGFINVTGITPNTVAFIVCIGETPQTLQPVALFNDSVNGFSAVGPVSFAGSFMIANPPAHSPALVDLTYTSESHATLSFRASDYSRQDMLMEITDAGVKTPIFISRLHKYMQDPNGWQDVIGNLTAYSSGSSATPWVYYSVNHPTRMRTVGDGSKFNFIPWDSYALFVNDYDPLSSDPGTSSDAVPDHRTGSNYYITDGKIAGTVIHDANNYAFTGLSTSGATATVPTTLASTSMVGQQATVVSGTNFIAGTYTVIGAVDGVSLTFSSAVTSGAGSNGVINIVVQLVLPHMKYIAKFDSSVILGGGVGNIDPNTGLKNDSSRTLYFSRALNPFDFTIAGASGAVHQTISQDDDGENISGFGVYTNTSTDQGPMSQLITAKKNCLWILNALPVVDSGSLGSATSRILAKKVGGYHDTFANTPVGTIVASFDNVYLLRENGDPIPVGQAISKLLKAANMSRAVACYHDKHYKLAFSHPDYSGYNSGNSNNVEMWLNINKMIEKKGSEDWVGPMVGRAVDFVFVEDKDVDGSIYNDARDRYVIDKVLHRIYLADYSGASSSNDVEYDTQTSRGDAADTTVTSILTTKDFDITQQDNNWVKLLKRFYLKCRTNFATSLAAHCSYQFHVDGTAQTAVNFGTSISASAGAFDGKPLNLIRLFPVGRLRGRTFRLTFTFTKKVAIGGLQINYQVERRRV